MSERLTGGCQCGAIRYEVVSDDLEAYYCHCRMCQKAFGNIFATFINVPRDQIQWLEGEPAYFESSKLALRGFCAHCGTPLSFHYHSSKRMDLSVGSLDEPARVHPAGHYGVESRVAPFHRPDGLPEHRTDENEEYLAKWHAAYGEDSEPGPQAGQ